MSVTLRKRKNADGSISLLLDIYEDGKRRYEFLKHLRLSKITNPTDRVENKNKLEQAKKIELERAKQLEADNYGLDTDAAKKVIVLQWMQAYVDKYKLKDKRNMQGVVNRFKNFLTEEGITGLTMKKLNEVVITDFRDYLLPLSEGEGAASYFSRFKRIVKAAHKARLLPNNPAADVKVKGLGNARKKDILTLDEIQTLAAIPTESNEVKKAFLFSCVTGLRWIDIKTLQWKDIKLNATSKQIVKRQTKTDKDVMIDLNQTALQLIGNAGKPNDFVFELPTANGANKTLKAWIKRAGIDKKITWHNARHSFGTNLLYNEVDIITASKLLGHTSLRHTQRYVDASKQMKIDAVNKLNINLLID